MPKAHLPSPEEFHETVRRLLGLIAEPLPEAMTDAAIWIIIERRTASARLPRKVAGALLALRACAEVLRELRLPAEVRELRDALDAYADWHARGAPLARLRAAALAAGPQMEAIGLQLKNARRVAHASLTAHERATGQSAHIWPSSGAIGEAGQVVAVLEQHRDVVDRSRKALHDLARLDAAERIDVHVGPIKKRVGDVLHAAGYTVAEITTVTEPFCGRGAARRTALNTVRNRLKLAPGEWHVAPIAGQADSAGAVAPEYVRAGPIFILGGQGAPIDLAPDAVVVRRGGGPTPDVTG